MRAVCRTTAAVLFIPWSHQRIGKGSLGGTAAQQIGRKFFVVLMLRVLLEIIRIDGHVIEKDVVVTRVVVDRDGLRERGSTQWTRKLGDDDALGREGSGDSATAARHSTRSDNARSCDSTRGSHRGKLLLESCHVRNGLATARCEVHLWSERVSECPRMQRTKINQELHPASSEELNQTKHQQQRSMNTVNQ